MDLRVPEHARSLREELDTFPPIFKNVELTRDDLPPKMRSYAETMEIMKQPRRSLISSHYGNKMLITTPLLQYVNHTMSVLECKLNCLVQIFLF